MDLTNQVVAVDRQLLFDFFVAFARFEYALKASGKARRRSRGLARRRPGETKRDRERLPIIEPDWKRFADSLRNNFDATATGELTRACEYLRDIPPNIQVVNGNAVMWETPEVVEGEAEVVFLLRMVKIVRNNLFHGSKHNIAVHEDVQRTEMLLLSSLVVLGACLDLAPRQLAAYVDARL